jgi:sulfonate transport system substrate-binding protein
MKSVSSILSVFLVTLFVKTAAAQPKVIRFGEVGGTSVKSVGGKPQGVQLVPLALERGLFAEAFGPDGPKIEVVYFAGTGPAQNEALAQGDIDFGSYGGLPNVIGLASGIPAHIISIRQMSNSGYYLGVRPDSPIKTLADLKGKRIAVQKGTNPYQTLVRFLEGSGIKESEVNIVNLQGGEALVAFTAGAIDVVFQGTNLLLLRDQGKARIVASTKGFRHDGNTSGLLVNDQFEKAYPDVVARVVKVLTKAAHWASQEENREALLRFVSARTFAYDYVKDEYAGSLKDRYDPVIDEDAISAYATTARFAAERKLIRKAPDLGTVRGWFKPAYQQAALDALGLQSFWNGAAKPLSKTSPVTTAAGPR